MDFFHDLVILVLIFTSKTCYNVERELPSLLLQIPGLQKAFLPNSFLGTTLTTGILQNNIHNNLELERRKHTPVKQMTGILPEPGNEKHPRDRNSGFVPGRWPSDGRGVGLSPLDKGQASPYFRLLPQA